VVASAVVASDDVSVDNSGVSVTNSCVTGDTVGALLAPLVVVDAADVEISNTLVVVDSSTVA